MSFPTAPLGDLLVPVKTWNPRRATSAEAFDYIDLSSVDRDEKAIIAPTSTIPAEAPSRARQLVNAGDILVSTVRPNLNAVAVVDEDLDGATASTGFSVLRPNSKKAAPRYIYHWVRTPSFVADMVRKATGASYPAVSDRIVAESLIPLPPIEEQRRIAGILDAADALRRRRREALALLDTLPGAIFAEMFGDPTLNPRQLDTLPLREFAVLERGKSKHRPRNDPKLLGGPHPLVQTGDVANAGGYIEHASSSYSDFGLKQSRKWPAGTLCITIAANIADGAILTFPACFPDSVVGCTVREYSHAEFIRVWLMSVKGRIEKVAPAVAQKNINLKILGAVPIIIPPESEIRKFSDIVQQLREDRNSAVEQMKEIETLFASLQSRAFAGEL